MADPTKHTATSLPAPPTGRGQHSLPRRASPENSITLQHHRHARNASLRGAGSVEAPGLPDGAASLRRRTSSDESHDTGHSDPVRWFDQSNENPLANFDSHAMDVEPPFFQKETDSSYEDASKARPFNRNLEGEEVHATPKPIGTRSSSTDDYRSVIDDLTVEIQRLKEELKRYKQNGSDTLKKDKLFEIKVHGLPRRKKRELEATLREFAAGLERTPSAEASSSQRNKSRHANRVSSGSGSHSKYQSSSSGSRSRPVDSAYASMSTGQTSSGPSQARPQVSTSRPRSADQKVESYLKDIPEGLYPRHMSITEKEKKKLVVRRLEHLFTGKLTGKNLVRNTSKAESAAPLVPVTTEPPGGGAAILRQPAGLQLEPAREARILQSDGSNQKSRSRDNASASQSNGGDRTESGGHGNAGGSGTSPLMGPPPEQRPTRPRDLDPDRVQNPSENMEYIRHLGLVPPELLATSAVSEPLSPDADGWVYLNLLCNMAQLHMLNVAPDFIRAAVTEKSTKLQLSADGRKIRWRGGTDGTKFSSDSSGDNSQKSPSTDEADSSNEYGQRKKQKTQAMSTGNQASGLSSKAHSKFVPQTSEPAADFHYKPMIVRRSSSHDQMSLDDTVSSFGPPEESNIEGSRWDRSGSGSSPRKNKKRRLDGAITYYNGAPFFTDLSGDPGDVSPSTYLTSTGQEGQGSPAGIVKPASTAADPVPTTGGRPLTLRTSSGSVLPFRPLVDGWPGVVGGTTMRRGTSPPDPEEVVSDENSLDDCQISWSDSLQLPREYRLEPCGLGGVLPDDHFVVTVTSRRSKTERHPPPQSRRRGSSQTTDSIIGRLAAMMAPSPAPTSPRHESRISDPALDIEYVSGRIKRLPPMPLPPALSFLPPFSTSSSSDNMAGEFDSSVMDDDDMSDESSEELMSRRANPHRSDEGLAKLGDSGAHAWKCSVQELRVGAPDVNEHEKADEEEDRAEQGDEEEGSHDSGDSDRDGGRRIVLRRASTGRSSGVAAHPPSSAEVMPRTGSSVATAGDVESGYNSSGEESP